MLLQMEAYYQSSEGDKLSYNFSLSAPSESITGTFNEPGQWVDKNGISKRWAAQRLTLLTNYRETY